MRTIDILKRANSINHTEPLITLIYNLGKKYPMEVFKLIDEL